MKFAIQVAYKRSARNKKLRNRKKKKELHVDRDTTYIYVSGVDIQMYRQKYMYRLIFITLSSVICFMIFQLQDTFYNNTCIVKSNFSLQQRHINIIEDQRHIYYKITLIMLFMSLLKIINIVTFIIFVPYIQIYEPCRIIPFTRFYCDRLKTWRYFLWIVNIRGRNYVDSEH